MVSCFLQERETDRQTDRQTGRQAGRQAINFTINYRWLPGGFVCLFCFIFVCFRFRFFFWGGWEGGRGEKGPGVKKQQLNTKYSNDEVTETTMILLYFGTFR